MTPQQAAAKIREKVDKINDFRKTKVPDIVGTEAVNHFKASFANEGFTDKTLTKWKNVQRRNPASPWYGFSMENKNHFSNTRALDKVLTGETKELQNSVTYIKQDGKVTVFTDKEYAAVHQFGLTSKIFGKKSFQQTARPFIGKSDVLLQNIYKELETELEKIKKE